MRGNCSSHIKWLAKACLEHRPVCTCNSGLRPCTQPRMAEHCIFNAHGTSYVCSWPTHELRFSLSLFKGKNSGPLLHGSYPLMPALAHLRKQLCPDSSVRLPSGLDQAEIRVKGIHTYLSDYGPVGGSLHTLYSGHAAISLCVLPPTGNTLPISSYRKYMSQFLLLEVRHFLFPPTGSMLLTSFYRKYTSHFLPFQFLIPCTPLPISLPLHFLSSLPI